MKKANKQIMELRAGFSADLLSLDHSCTFLMPRVAEIVAKLLVILNKGCRKDLLVTNQVGSLPEVGK